MYVCMYVRKNVCMHYSVCIHAIHIRIHVCVSLQGLSLNTTAKMAAALTQGLRICFKHECENEKTRKHVLVTWGELYPYEYTMRQMKTDGASGENQLDFTRVFTYSVARCDLHLPLVSRPLKYDSAKWVFISR